MSNDWIEDLSKRGHVLHGHLDHFSILLEDIPDYVKDPTFNQQKLRDVYTIARAGYRQDDIVILQPVDKTKEIDDIYAYFHQSYLKASKEEIKHNRVHSTRVVWLTFVYNFHSIFKIFYNFDGSFWTIFNSHIQHNKNLVHFHCYFIITKLLITFSSILDEKMFGWCNLYKKYINKKLFSSESTNLWSLIKTIILRIAQKVVFLLIIIK